MRHDAARTPENRRALADMGRRSLDEESGGASLSGHEHNHLFLSRGGAEFDDISGVSGLDHPADGRAFGILDYDRDGWQDLAVVNANSPLLQLFRNQIGCHPATASQRSRAGRIVALRLVGGNHSARTSGEWSARDGYGALVTVDTGEEELVREHRAGEGFAAQNSATLIVGIGKTRVARSVSVRWPSGKTQTELEVPAGTLVTVFENPAHSPTREVFVRQPYGKNQPPPRGGTGAAAAASRGRRLTLAHDHSPAARLRLYTTMATWCTACRSELPHLRRLRDAFAVEELAMFGVPIDLEEGAEQIEAWRLANRPVYELLSGLTREQVLSVRALVLDGLASEAVPVTLVTDEAGRLLHMQWGPPSISKLRQLLHRTQEEESPRRCPS